MLTNMRLLPRGKLITTLEGTITWTDEGNWKQPVAFHLFEHPWFGRSCKAMGYGLLDGSPKDHPLYQKIIYPWLKGKNFKFE